jgi:CTP:molybdopterin cytidylyltransferase MocA
VAPSSLAEVVVLAAGRSSRMGEPKGLVRVDGRPWILHQLDALAGRRVVVVLGEDRARYEEVVPSLAARVPPATVVVNPAPDRGPFSSLQVGLAALAGGPAASRARSVAAFVLPVDVPAASADVWTALEAALGDRDGIDAAVPEHEGRGGHPVLLAPSLLARLGTAPASSRLDELLRALPPGRLRRVQVGDPRIRLNLNAPEDWGKVAQGG